MPRIGLRPGQMPVRSYSMLNNESSEFVRFINPSDLRVASLTCGRIGCHVAETGKVPKSMMATAPMLWEAALYNNGVYPEKIARFGESYSKDGNPTRLKPSRHLPKRKRSSTTYCLTSIRCRVLKSLSPATYCACSSAEKTG